MIKASEHTAQRYINPTTRTFGVPKTLIRLTTQRLHGASRIAIV